MFRPVGEIKAKLDSKRIIANTLLRDPKATVDAINNITEELENLEKELQQETERAALTGDNYNMELGGNKDMTEVQNKIYNQAKDLQNFIAGRPHTMEIQNSINTTSGGAAVGTELSREIIRDLKERAGVYSFFDGRVGKGNWDIIVIADEEPAVWVPEGTTPAEGSISTSKITLTQHRLYKELVLTQQLVNASPEEFVRAIKNIVVDAILDTLETAILQGTGTEQPTGLVTGLAAERKLSYSTAVSLSDLKTLKHKLKMADWETAAFIMDAEMYSEIDQLTTSEGMPLLQPSVKDTSGEKLLGLPVKISQGAATGEVIVAHPGAYETNTQKGINFMVFNDSAYMRAAKVGIGCDIFVDGKLKNGSKAAVLQKS